MNIRKGTLLLLAIFGASACGDPGTDNGSEQSSGDDIVVDVPLVDRDSLLGDSPDNSELVRYDEKFDVVLPKQFDTVETQSPVRSQASRGVCSIFSTVGLMEHLYIKSGVNTSPDFSEQFLQWSAKVEIGGFPNTGGSSARVNLQAVTRHGVVEEQAWPYEGSGWGTSDDPECTGDSRPTRCYTNGDPSEEVLAAERHKLPDSDWVSAYTDSLKTYMFKNERAVVCGMDFFYQSWGHGGSKLQTNGAHKKVGAVTYPSEADKTDSNERPAGHSILLVGWDDEIEFPRLGEDGKPLEVDGSPVVDKGFFVFKNSWGTGGWGRENPYGDGYGYLSYRYVSEFGRCMSAEEPEEQTPKVEICGDGIDNDENGSGDCDDSVCAEHPSCIPTSDTQTFSLSPGSEIPDNDPDGYVSELEVEMNGTIEALTLNVAISHPYNGDLEVLLESPTGNLAVIKESDANDETDWSTTRVLEDFNGQGASGVWKLHVMDAAQADIGTLEEWSLEITTQ